MRQADKLMTLVAWFMLLTVVAAVPAAAALRPDRSPTAEALALRHPDLTIETLLATPDELPAAGAAAARHDLSELGVAPENGRLDMRSARWATLILSHPLIPGDGVGNGSHWAAGPPVNQADLRARVWQAFSAYLFANASVLRLDPAEMPEPGLVTILEDGDVIQIWAPQVIDGLPVRDSYVTAVINHGNLVLLGAHNWGDVGVSTEPILSHSDAAAVVAEYLTGLETAGIWRRASLAVLPLANGVGPSRVEPGQGLRHRLVWTVRPQLAGDPAHWEALVDAATGELLAFQDINQYATTREVKGGVYPVSNDGAPPDGVEQAGWPMPFASVTTQIGTQVTDTGGNVPIAVDGNISTDLSGPFIRMDDVCGPISLSSPQDLDFGTSGGDDCVTPGFGGAGNTHSSRTGFYELNRIKEQARAQLPANGWLTNQLTANMNINSQCNAFWDGFTVNFYRSGGGCGNTGELAGVFDHEWGHGMDDNDANPSISSPGEGIADLYAALRLDDSCIGRGFFDSGNCTGYGDPCIDCSGIRDIDFAMRQSGDPHDYTWSNANCGGIVHCQGAVYAEAVWDLYTRALPMPPYAMNPDTALEVTTRLTFLGAGNVGTWFSGGPPFGGCGANGGYLQYLAADDDNGNISDGTPHMAAIFGAFNVHEIACNSPAVQDSGCLNTPTSAPLVSGEPLDKQVSLSWDAVADATEYHVFRAEGVFACEFGKVKVAETVSTSFIDSDLQNGRAYSYVVIPVGGANTCMGPASACTTVSPASGPNLDVDAGSAVLTIATGDGDQFLDNCEMATMTFDVVNTGLGDLTNAQIVDVTSPSHPLIIFDTPFPAPISPPNLPQGGSGVGTFDFTAEGLSFGDTVILQVDFTADELGIVKSQNLEILSAEGDFQNFPSITYDFENGTDGWLVAEGTFNRSNAGGGAGGTLWYEASSSFLDEQCDRIRSPILSLRPDSTLTVWNNFDIEPLSNGTWYDRANVGIIEANGSRTAVNPDSGRLYNAGPGGPGSYSGCNAGERGWADTAATWAPSQWSAAALQAGVFAGQPVQLEVIYSTDPLINGFGLHFDEVTVTDVDLLAPDTQPNVCVAGDLVLSAPTPGLAGQVNDWDASGATPAGRVAFAFGLDLGSFTAPCGAALDIDSPKLLGIETADGAGGATLSRFVPDIASGVTALFQAVDLTTCTVSNLVEFAFP